MNFSLVLTTYNRANIVFENLKKYCEYDNIDEIIVVDDCSGDYEKLITHDWPNKVHIHKNETNLKAYKNKIKALSLIKNTWGLLIDSDNFIEKIYIDTLLNENIENFLNEDTVYYPTAAKPFFIYKHLDNQIFDKINWNEFSSKEGIFFNTCNFCISKKAIDVLNKNLETDNTDPFAVDCKYFSYLLIKNNFKIKALKNLEYDHPKSPDSFYIENTTNSTRFDVSFDWNIQQ